MGQHFKTEIIAIKSVGPTEAHVVKYEIQKLASRSYQNIIVIAQCYS